MQTWLSIEEFSQITAKPIEEIKYLCKENKLNYKEEDGEIFIEISNNNSLMPLTQTEIIESPEITNKAITTIIALHEKVLEAKDETISTLKGENDFLKSSVISVQEIYDEDRKTIETLQNQLKIMQEELEFCRRKYKLMWKKAIKKEDEDE